VIDRPQPTLGYVGINPGNSGGPVVDAQNPRQRVQLRRDQPVRVRRMGSDRRADWTPVPDERLISALAVSSPDSPRPDRRKTFTETTILDKIRETLDIG
jgi:hypothetical protein